MSQVFHNAEEASFALIGANGFIGKRIRVLAKDAGYSIVPFTRSEPIITSEGIDPRAAEVDTVVWAASSITPATASADPSLVTAEQRDFREIIAGLEQLPKPPRLIVMSSGGTVYGGTSAPFSEEDTPRPVNAYGHAKFELECIAEQSSLQTTVLRVANAYGIGQRSSGGQGVIGHWLRAICDGKPIVIYGDGSSVRDYIYVDDIASAVLAACQYRQDAEHETFNVGSGEPTTLSKLAEICLEITGYDGEIRYEPDRGFDATTNFLDISAAAEKLGWHAQIPLHSGIALTWEWLTENGRQ